jgi:hypothetical protein
MTPTAQRITEGKPCLVCPHCGRAIISADHAGIRTELNKPVFVDGDTGTPPAVPEGTTAFCAWNIGEACCSKPYFSWTVCFIRAEVNQQESFADLFFWGNGNKGAAENFLVENKSRAWLMQVFETPRGRLYEHFLPTTTNNSPAMLQELWPDILALSASELVNL